MLEVDYKNICVRSARRLLPAQPQGDGQEQAGSSSGGSRRGRERVKTASDHLHHPQGQKSAQANQLFTYC